MDGGVKSAIYRRANGQIRLQVCNYRHRFYLTPRFEVHPDILIVHWGRHDFTFHPSWAARLYANYSRRYARRMMGRANG